MIVIYTVLPVDTFFTLEESKSKKVMGKNYEFGSQINELAEIMYIV